MALVESFRNLDDMVWMGLFGLSRSGDGWCGSVGYSTVPPSPVRFVGSQTVGAYLLE